MIDEIALFVKYGVAESDQAAAMAVVEKYRDHPQAMAVLLEFYKTLPEAREEPVTRLGTLDGVQGVTLLLVSTPCHHYTAVVSEGEAHILGEYGREPIPPEILQYFGHGDSETFYAAYGEAQETPELTVKDGDKVCPICQVAVGEYHVLGCPVEVCPWCDGQLSHCNCRFEKLEVESVESEEQIETLLELLKDKGRIPYRPEQKPGYPGTSAGLDR
ncbi:MAG: hypothetical protein ACK5PS_07455 [Desulfopila sp.]